MNNGVSETHTHNLVQHINGVDLNPRNKELANDQAAKLLTHFHYHKPNSNTIPCYNAINEAAKLFAETIMKNTPPGPDQTAAVRKVVEAKMTANSAIATNPELY